MGTFIGKVAAVFTANTSGLVTGTREATAALTKMESNVKSISTGMNALVAIQGAQLFAGVAQNVASATGSFIRMNQVTAEVIDAQSKLSRKIGVSLADFQSLALAGDLAGVSQEKVAGAIGKMGINLANAANGSKSAEAGFKALGLSVTELQGMNAAQQFEAISVAISKLPTPAEQAAAAVKVFGKGGKDLLDIFANGGAAVKEAAEYAELFGLALSNEAGQNVEKMMDDFTVLGKLVEGFKTQLVAAFAPAVSEQITAVIEKIKELGGIKNVAQDTAIFLAEAAGKFVDAGAIFASKIDVVLTALNKSIGAIGALGQAALGIGQGFQAGVQQIGAIGADIALTDQRDPASQAQSDANYQAAYETRISALENIRAFDNWLMGRKPAETPEATAGSKFAEDVRAAVERERQAAAERERARAAATDSTKRDGLGAAAATDPKAEKTMAEQLAALREVAANTAKQAVMTVFNIPGAAAR